MTANWTFWLRVLPTRPGDEGWATLSFVASQLPHVDLHTARKAMQEMRSRGLVERGGQDEAGQRLYRITPAGLRLLREDRLMGKNKTAPKPPRVRAQARLATSNNDPIPQGAS